MKTHAAWAVAAAILVKAGKPLHYTDITQRIIESDLSRLSDEGGRTPEQTVGAALRHHDGIFSQDSRAGDGYYYLPDDEAALNEPKVQAAFAALSAKGG